MDCKASTHNLLERMLLDASVEPTNIPIALLSAITNGFSDDQKIGSGGFAVVYKGQLQNGTVAVKKLFNKLDMDDEKFIKEIRPLRRVKHKNIVRFLGYCADTQGEMWDYEGKMVIAQEPQRLLCFEFLPKGSLDNYITDASKGLEWRTRYQIIKGICEGLHYLHQNNIVHLDLKPANILLNDDMVPKIADFGLSRCFDEKQSRAMTINLLGTPGYLAPEFYTTGLITLKSDIYSLGVIIIEILTGQKDYPEIKNVLESWSHRFETSGDKQLEHVRICAEIGIKCTDYNGMERPPTGRIIEMLKEMESKYGFTETDLCTSWVAHAEVGSFELQCGIPKVPGGTSSETSTSRVSKLADGLQAMGVSTAPSRLQRIVSVPKGPGETSSSEIRSLGSTEITKLLDVHPLELCFPFKPNERVQCPVSLTNRTDQYVGVWIRQTNPDARSDLHFPVSFADEDLEAGLWSSLLVILQPHSTLVEAITLDRQLQSLLKEKRKKKKYRQQQPPPQDPDEFEVLMIIMRSEKDLKFLESSISEYLNLDNRFWRIVEAFEGEVHRAMLIADPAGCQEVIRFQECGGLFKAAVIYDPASCQEVIRFHYVSMLLSKEEGLHSSKKDAMSEFGYVRCIDVHPTETWILVGHENYFTDEDGWNIECPDGYVSIWNYETQKIVSVLQVTKKTGTLNRARSIWSAKFIAREQWFATGDRYGCVHVYAYTTKDKVTEFEAHENGDIELAVHPTDPFLLTGSYDGGIMLWDWSKGWECTRRFVVDNVQRLMFNPRDRHTFASVSDEGTVKVWDIGSSKPITTLVSARKNVGYLSTDSHWHFLVTCGNNGRNWFADIWDSQTSKLVHTIYVSGWTMNDVACHPTLPLFVTLSRLNSTCGESLCLWNASTYRLEKMVDDDSMGFPSHGTMLFNGTKDLTRLVFGSHEEVAVMEINLPTVRTDGGNEGV